jgi:hypothetical protein
MQPNPLIVFIFNFVFIWLITNLGITRVLLMVKLTCS